MGVIITNKELALIAAPLVNIALNASANAIFARMTYYSAKDFFRILWLKQKYGEEAINSFFKSQNITAIN